MSSLSRRPRGWYAGESGSARDAYWDGRQWLRLPAALHTGKERRAGGALLIGLIAIGAVTVVGSGRADDPGTAPPPAVDAQQPAPHPRGDDAQLRFSVASTSRVQSASSPDSIRIHLSVTNTGTQPVTFEPAAQRLLTTDAGGRALPAEGSPTAVPPSGIVETVLVFTVTPGAAPETLELHGTPDSAGTRVRLP